MCTARVLMNCIAVCWLLYTSTTVAAWVYFLTVTSNVAQWHLILLSSLVWVNVAQFGAFVLILVCMRAQHTTLKVVKDWKPLPSRDVERFEVGDIELKPRKRVHRKPRKHQQLAEEEEKLEVAISRIESAMEESALPPTEPPSSVDEMRNEVESDLNPES